MPWIIHHLCSYFQQQLVTDIPWFTHSKVLNVLLHNPDLLSLVEALAIVRSRAWKVIWRYKRQSSLEEDVSCSDRIIIVAIIIKISELLVLECKVNSGSMMRRNRAGHRPLRSGSQSQFYKLFSYLNILMQGKWRCVAPETEEKQLSSCTWIGSAAVDRAECVPWSPFGLEHYTVTCWKFSAVFNLKH